jgi:hypothetical protein
MPEADDSQKLPRLDSAEWLLTNEQRSVAIKLQGKKVQDLEQTRQSAHQQRVELELQKEKDDVLNYKEGIRELDRQARQRWLDDAAQRQTEKLAAVDKLKREKTEQRDLREKIRARDRQRKLDGDAARRAEVRRVKEVQEAERAERSRLNSLAIVQQTQDTLRLREEARAARRCGENISRADAGIKATGQLKRPADTQHAIEPSHELTPGRVDSRRSRYVYRAWS